MQTDTKDERHTILSEPMKGLFFRLSLPSVIGMGLMGINGFVDALAVGRTLGEEALAGAGVGFALSSLPMGIGNLVGSGSSALLSIALGRRDGQVLSRIYGNVLTLSLTLGSLLALLGWLLAPTLVGAMGAEGVAFQAGVDFFRVQALGTFFLVAGMSLNMMVRAEGQMKPAMVMAGLGALVNIALVFPMCHAFGVSGAAGAGIVSFVVYLGLGLWWFSSRQRSHLSIERLFQLRFDREIVRRVVAFGSPGFIISSMGLVQHALVYRALDLWGSPHDDALYGALARVSMLALFPIFGLMRAFQPVAGVSYGAGRYDRLKEGTAVFTAFATALMFLLLLPLVLSTQTVLQVLLPGSTITPDDLTAARLYFLPFLGYPLIFIGMTLLQNTEQGGAAGLLTLGRQLLFFGPLALILPPIFGVRGVYMAYAATDIAVVLLTLLLLARTLRRLPKPEARETAPA